LSPEAALAAIPYVIEKGLMLLPNVSGGSGPFPGRERQWVNDMEVSTDQRWAAACLYLALMTETCLDLIGAKGPVLVEGPFSANPAYLQALAALLGREVMALPGSTGTSQGAALLAGISPKTKPGRIVTAPTWNIEPYRTAWHESLRP
jgi:sugar (pentulose or hexulose) kinase